MPKLPLKQIASNFNELKAEPGAMLKAYSVKNKNNISIHYPIYKHSYP
jgi:hypothetical protein